MGDKSPKSAAKANKQKANQKAAKRAPDTVLPPAEPKAPRA